MRETLWNLESQFFNQSLSADEYFMLVISSCVDDLESAKNAIKSVLRKLEENYTKTQEETYFSLQRMYDDFFEQNTSNQGIESGSFSDNEVSQRFVRVSLQDSDIKNSQTDQRKTATKNKKKKKKNNKSSSTNNILAPVILWFRRDLRIFDNPALVKAAYNENGQERPVIPVFFWSEKEEKERVENGGAVKVWLKRGLNELNKSLCDRYGSRLILRSCEHSYEQELLNLIKETGAKTIVWTALYEPWILERDERIRYRLNGLGVKVHIEHSYLLHRPDEVVVKNTSKGIGSVVHFMECCRNGIGSRSPIGVPSDPPLSIKSPDIWPRSCELENMKLYVMPVRRDGTYVDWAKRINEPGTWKFGENGGYDQLCHFLENDIEHYEKESSRADMPWTSVMSPYLHWGEISPRTVLHEALSRGHEAAKFRRKLAWRDMSYWILSLFPDMDTQPIRPQYEIQWWSENKKHLKAWQKGNTGYPLVDAAMRQLWAIGWMNNYLRHVVASFLISYLRITWIEGYKWFQDTLLDADVAINAMMWQNGGMSGLDQWNFVMHPVDAAFTCDPKGDFIRKWIPTLSKLPDKFIHCPWNCPPGILARAGVVIGENYPQRIIVNLEEAREGSLSDVSMVRRHPLSSSYIDPHSGSDMLRISRKVLLSHENNQQRDDNKTNTTNVNNNDMVLIPLITRREFIYRTLRPNAKDNPYNAVLRGYVTRRRDEEVERLQRVDFVSGTILEEVNRYQKENDIIQEKPRRGRNRFKHKLDGKA